MFNHDKTKWLNKFSAVLVKGLLCLYQRILQILCSLSESVLNMADRKFVRAPQITTDDQNQIWNHPRPNPHNHLGNAAFVPMVGSSNSAVPRPLDYSSFSVNSGPVQNSYLHAVSTASSCQYPADQVLYLPPPSFNHRGSNMVDPQTEIGRPSFKRKAPVMSLDFDGGNPSGYYTGGSSSNVHISSNPLHQKPVAGPLYWPSHSSNFSLGYRGDNLFIGGESSQRNVRSRHNPIVNIEMNTAVTRSASNLPGYFCPAGNPLDLSMPGRVSHTPMPIAPQGRIQSSDPTFNHERPQSLAGPFPNFINTTTGTNRISHPNLTLSRNMAVALHDPLIRGLEVGNNGYIQRPNVHRSSSSCPAVGFGTSLEATESSGVSSSSASRYSRPPSVTGRNRNGRTRSSHSRFQPIYNTDSSRNRWYSENTALMGRSGFYDSRNLFDQHGDMMLDVDNMTYEELLALGERIGNVSTGLSDEKISQCLQVTTHCSSKLSENADEEEHCVICLEEYKDLDKLGKLTCRHDFHVSCIKNWLLIKNVCPICKAAASDVASKKRQ